MKQSLILGAMEVQPMLSQDTVEVVALALSLVLGFHLVAVLMRALGRTGCKADLVAAQETLDTCKTSCKADLAALQEEDICKKTAETVTVEEEEGEIDAILPAPRPHQPFQLHDWRALMEHYHVFGAEVGAWSECQANVEEEETLTAERDADTPLAPCMEAKAPAAAEVEVAPQHALPDSDTEDMPTPPLAWCALLEHYGVFGAPAGAWSEERPQTFVKEPPAHSETSQDLDPDWCRLPEPAPPPDWHMLLEHYGVFGAAAGAWSDSCQRAPAEEPARLLAPAPSSLPACQEFLEPPSPPRDWRMLLEHYDVFGADVGAWSGSLQRSTAEELAPHRASPPLRQRRPAPESNPPPAWRMLLDQYGAFGAAPGAWLEAC